jgi:DNA-binding response OmpR family regulator
MEIIIVQDTDEDILYILTTALRQEGFRVYPLLHCEDDFLEIIETTRPHVVVLDYKLSGEEALRVLHEIKAKYPQLPVIASSCNTNINEVYDTAGFDGYIPKPFDIDLLYRTLRKYIPKFP